MTDNELLEGLDQMVEDAPAFGLCAMPFEIIRDGVKTLKQQKDWLLQRRMSGATLPADFHIPLYQEEGSELPDVLMFIGRFSTDGHQAREQVCDAFLSGCCYWFAYILKARFEREYPCEIVIDYVQNHFACRINDSVYDITGLVTDGKWERWDDCSDDLLRDRILQYCVMF